MFSFTFYLYAEPTMRFWLGHNCLATVAYAPGSEVFSVELHSEFGGIYELSGKREVVQFLSDRFMLRLETFAGPIEMLCKIIEGFRSVVCSAFILREHDGYTVIEGNGLNIGRFSSIDDARKCAAYIANVS